MSHVPAHVRFQIIVPVDLNRIEILWWSPENEVTVIEELLKTAGEEIK